jgi:hypothetical protein
MHIEQFQTVKMRLKKEGEMRDERYRMIVYADICAKSTNMGRDSIRSWLRFDAKVVIPGVITTS